MSELLERAFMALGPEPSNRELELVAQALLESGDEDVLEAFTVENFDDTAEIAFAADSSPIVALHLSAELAAPGARLRRGKPPNPD